MKIWQRFIFSFLGDAYSSTINSITVNFTKSGGGDISQIERFKAHVDGGSNDQSCALEWPGSQQKPYRCTINGLPSAKGFLIISEQCRQFTNICVEIGRETMWTVPTGLHYAWVWYTSVLKLPTIFLTICTKAPNYRFDFSSQCSIVWQQYNSSNCCCLFKSDWR